MRRTGAQSQLGPRARTGNRWCRGSGRQVPPEVRAARHTARGHHLPQSSSSFLPGPPVCDGEAWPSSHPLHCASPLPPAAFCCRPAPPESRVPLPLPLPAPAQPEPHSSAQHERGLALSGCRKTEGSAGVARDTPGRMRVVRRMQACRGDQAPAWWVVHWRLHPTPSTLQAHPCTQHPAGDGTAHRAPACRCRPPRRRCPTPRARHARSQSRSRGGRRASRARRSCRCLRRRCRRQPPCGCPGQRCNHSAQHGTARHSTAEVCHGVSHRAALLCVCV